MKEKQKMKNRYYSLTRIKEKNAQYNIIFGERSNGKTYAVEMEGITNFVKTGKQMAILRRYGEDFTGKRGTVMFDSIVKNGEISKVTNGEWSGVYYYSSRWYFCRYEGDKRITAERPFCYGFALSAMEHDKSTSFPDITIILFDEFLSRTGYLPDEFVLFMNVLSTIIRDRNDVKIYMCGNTVNKFCPYFNEMGLKHIKEMESGDIDVYKYGESDLTVAVEYTHANKAGKASDLYFAFDNPKLSMITGGKWEIDIYPHCPVKYKPKEVIFLYFIIFDSNILQCEIVYHENLLFTFIHQKTTDIKNPESDLIYSPDYSPLPNRKRKITKPQTALEKKIAQFFIEDKVFYSDNETGEIVRNYLLWCKGESGK